MNQQQLLDDHNIEEPFNIRIMNPDFIKNLCQNWKKKIFFLFLVSASFFLAGLLTNFHVKASDQLGPLASNINKSNIFFLKLKNGSNCTDVTILNYYNPSYYDFDTKSVFNKHMINQNNPNSVCYNNQSYSKVQNDKYHLKCWNGYYFESSCPSNFFNNSLPLVLGNLVIFDAGRNLTTYALYFEEKVIMKESCLNYKTNLYCNFDSTKVYVFAGILIVLCLISSFITFRMSNHQKDSDIVESQQYVPGTTTTTKITVRDRITGSEEVNYKSKTSGGYTITKYVQIDQTPDDKLAYIRYYIITSSIEFILLSSLASKNITDLFNFLEFKKFGECFDNNDYNQIFISYHNDNYLHIFIFEGLALVDIIIFVIMSIFFIITLKKKLTFHEILKGRN